MTTITPWRTDEPCPVCATGLILHDDGKAAAWAECCPALKMPMKASLTVPM